MNGIWHMSGSLLSRPVKEALPTLISDDKKNYEKSVREFSDDLRLLDDALALYVESIKGAYSVQKKWQNQSSRC